MDRPGIVQLGPDDWAAFRSVRLESLERSPEVFGTGLEQELGQSEAWWRARLESPDVGVYAAFASPGADPVGMAGWLLQAPANLRHRAYVWGVYVRDGRRGGGLGRALVSAALAEATASAEAVDLHVLTNNVPAIRLYEALGFQIVGTVPRALKHAGIYRDQHMMVLDPELQSTPGTRQSPVV